MFSLQACAGKSVSSGSSRYQAPHSGTSAKKYKTRRPYKVGRPYKIRGKTYYPADDRDYDEVGLASWYGPGFHNKKTANGEKFDMDSMTAAHKTLPLPSFVRVTNLENGRSVILRVNDRGPFVGKRIIDLSRRAAQLLDMHRAGVGRVRVKRIYPSARQLRDLGIGHPDEVQHGPAGRQLKDTRRAAPSRSRQGQQKKVIFLVQVVALSDAARAQDVAHQLRRFGSVRVDESDNGLFRVRLGPYSTQEDALASLQHVVRVGYADARVVRLKRR